MRHQDGSIIVLKTEVCRVMSREQIHRVFVVDNRRLSGVISSLDIVRFLSTAL